MTEENGRNRMPSVEFTRRVELGHVIQAAAVVLSVSGGMLFGYETLQRRYDDLAQGRAVLEQRTTQNERAIAAVQDTQRAFQAEMRQQLSTIVQAITDVRVIVAGQGRDGGHR